MNKTFKTNYLARDFSSIKDELKKYAKRYYPDTLSDLSEASLNTFIIDSVAYVGDILSYYLDYQTNETFLSTAVESRNVLSLANSLGYRQKNTSTTVGKASLYLLVPSDSNGNPDYSKAPIIQAGTTLSSVDGASFIISDNIKIDENTTSDHVVARTNNLGIPTYFAVKLYVPIISGNLKTINITVEEFKKFNKIQVPDSSLTEIISIVDSEGNKYHQVPNITQNIVYVSEYNSDEEPKYILKPISAQRRYVLDYSQDGVPYIMFGGKQYKPDEDLTINPIAEPGKFILNKYNNDFLDADYFEPNKLLNGDNYGIGPDNTVLTITYRANSLSVNNNANIGDVNGISSLNVVFDDNLVDTNTKNTIIASIQVTNEEPIVGDSVAVYTDEIKNIAGLMFNSQNRAVTAKDYEAVTYMMPQKYGSIKRVKAYRDATSLKNNINLYIICSDKNENLSKANTKIKENIKTWLSEYKVITDTVDILDAKIINFGIDYVIKVDPTYDKIETISKVTARLRNLYSIKPQIGESFNILNIYREIRKEKGVLDIIDIKISNKNSTGYSSLYFNIDQNITADKNIIKIPKNAIYEIKYISDNNGDIKGKAT